MREILFRGKTIKTGKWVEGLLWKKKYKSNKWFISCFPDKDDNEECFVVDPETVCQFTGLTDKNGVKIFENDIIRDCNEDNEVFTVKYYAHRRYPAFDCEPEMHCDCNGLSYLMETGALAVIGNIFDNPELMEGGAIDDETMA